MMKELIRIEERDGVQTVNARELHKFLEVGRDYSNWIKNRIEQYDFIEGEDYSPVLANNTGEKGKPRIEYYITLPMAKELAMVENNERGKQVRRWIIRKLDRIDALQEMEQWKMRSLITSREVALKLCISVRTVQAWTCAGRLPYTLIGNMRRYKVEDVLRFIEQHYVPVTDAQPALPF